MLTSEQALSKVQFRERSLEITRTLGSINLDNLKEELEEVGSESVWWGVLAAQAQGDAERAKLRTEVVRAETGRKMRQEFIVRNEKITEDKVDEAVKLSESYQKTKEAEIEAFEKAGMLSAVRFAVDRKQKTLEGLSYMLAMEMGARAAGARAVSPEDKLRENMRDEMARAIPATTRRGRRAAAPIAPVAPAAPSADAAAPVSRRRAAAE